MSEERLGVCRGGQWGTGKIIQQSTALMKGTRKGCPYCDDVSHGIMEVFTVKKGWGGLGLRSRTVS